MKTTDGGWLAEFTSYQGYSSELVWEVLTNKDYVKQWYSELRMHNLREGGNIIFDFGMAKFMSCLSGSIKRGRFSGLRGGRRRTIADGVYAQ